MTEFVFHRATIIDPRERRATLFPVTTPDGKQEVRLNLRNAPCQSDSMPLSEALFLIRREGRVLDDPVNIDVITDEVDWPDEWPPLVESVT